MKIEKVELYGYSELKKILLDIITEMETGAQIDITGLNLDVLFMDYKYSTNIKSLVYFNQKAFAKGHKFIWSPSGIENLMKTVGFEVEHIPLLWDHFRFQVRGTKPHGNEVLYEGGGVL